MCARFVNKIYFKSRREDFFSSDNIIVTAGGIQACHVCLGLVLETRQDVLLTSLPAYPLYQMETAYYGATFSATEIENGRATPTPEALRRAFYVWEKHAVYRFSADSPATWAGLLLGCDLAYY